MNSPNPVLKYVELQLAPLNKRLAEVEKRLAELEQRRQEPPRRKTPVIVHRSLALLGSVGLGWPR